MAELEEELMDLVAPTLVGTIARTLLGLGPVLWLFINIHTQMWDRLMLNAGLAVLGTAWITYTWIDYFIQYKKHKERIRNKNRKNVGLFPMLILYFILAIAAIYLISKSVEFLFAPDDYLFYEFHPVAGKVLLFLTIIVIIL